MSKDSKYRSQGPEGSETSILYIHALFNLYNVEGYITNVTSLQPRHLTPCVTLVSCHRVRNGLHIIVFCIDFNYVDHLIHFQTIHAWVFSTSLNEQKHICLLLTLNYQSPHGIVCSESCVAEIVMKCFDKCGRASIKTQHHLWLDRVPSLAKSSRFQKWQNMPSQMLRMVALAGGSTCDGGQPETLNYFSHWLLFTLTVTSHQRRRF